MATKFNNRSEKVCLGCSSILPKPSIGNYAFCFKCGTANLDSLNDAEEDNRKYFNQHFNQQFKKIPFRLTLFKIFNMFHELLNFRVEQKFQCLMEEVDRYFSESKLAIEIGFGSGDELHKRLIKGFNCLGFDLSRSAVDAFRRKYPQYSDKVFLNRAGEFPFKANMIYSNALFEHLDNPDEFLRGANEQLEAGGYLIIRLPILVGLQDNRGALVDINLWDPCHRALYTNVGLKTLLNDHGFKIIKQVNYPYYGYKVMNQLLIYGFKSIQEIRCPYYEIKGLSLITYIGALFRALFTDLPCEESSVIAKKCSV